LFLRVRRSFEDANKGQTSISVGKIHSVTNQKLIFTLPTQIINFDWDLAAIFFVEQTANLDGGTIFGFEMPFDLISVAFASTVALGGVMGYVKAKSTYSLIAGLAFGGILGFGAYQTSVNPRNYYLTLGTSAVLGAFMGYRAFNSGKFMPAGLVATLSLLMVLRFTVRAITDTNYLKK